MRDPTGDIIYIYTQTDNKPLSKETDFMNYNYAVVRQDIM